MDPTPPSQRAPLNESARASRRNWLCTLGGLGASTVLGGHLTAQAQATTASKATTATAPADDAESKG